MSARIVTLGCRLNLSESERIAAMLGEDGNTVVVNSCAVTNEAVRQTRQAIRRLRKEHKDARLVVTGCAGETERAALADMPEVDGFVANAEKLDPRVWNLPPASAATLGSHTRSFIGVQNGCDHACTFCIIPQGRGASRSLPVDEVLRAIEADMDRGAREVVLTGVDLTSWGHDLAGSPTLGTLVEAILDRLPALPRLRLSSLDGIEVDEALFARLTQDERVMPHVHLSLQHGHDLILKRMKRRHLRADALDLIARLKSQRPDIAIGADLIAGFPTETEEHHAANLSLIAQADIVHGHTFPYSPRHDTPAARMPQHDRSLIKRRAAELREAVRRVRSAWLESHLGRPQSVLVEKDGHGYTPTYARMKAPADASPGSIVRLTPRTIENGILQ